MKTTTNVRNSNLFCVFDIDFVYLQTKLLTINDVSVPSRPVAQQGHCSYS